MSLTQPCHTERSLDTPATEDSRCPSGRNHYLAPRFSPKSFVIPSGRIMDYWHMGLNPRQRRNRARLLEEQARLTILIPPDSAASNQRPSRQPPPTNRNDAPHRTPPRKPSVHGTSSPHGSTPKGRLSLSPPSSESPRKLLRIRLHIQTRIWSSAPGISS